MHEDLKEEIIKLIREELANFHIPVRYQEDIAQDIIKQRHIGDGLIIFRGLLADRPDGSSDVKAWFSIDTNILSIWDGSEWVEFARIPANLATYTPINVTTDRSYNADTVVVAELADVVGTLIADLQAIGLIG